MCLENAYLKQAKLFAYKIFKNNILLYWIYIYIYNLLANPLMKGF